MIDRIFGPKSAGHPSIGEACPVCFEPFKEGDYTVLRAVEPADDEERAKMNAGRPYTAIAIEVHSDHSEF